MAPGDDNYNRLTDFFREEYQSLSGFVRARLEDTADRDAEDIVQDVALRLLTRTPDPVPVQNIAGYVYRAVRNRIIDVLRSRPSPREASRDADPWSVFAGMFQDEPDAEIPESVFEALQQAIAGLRPEYQRVIRALDFDGYTYRELSEESGIPAGTLMSWRHRALAELQGILKHEQHTN